MAHSKQDARNWLKTVAHNHLSTRTRSYTYSVYTKEPTISSSLGLQMDLSPQEGKVVEINDDWLLVKKGRAAEFFICARHLLEQTPDIGATVKITPYARRGFDGRRLDEPVVEDCGNGLVVRRFLLGATESPLPIDKATLSCFQLKEMISQIEALKAPDGVRRLSQVLIDAGACNGPVSYLDPTDEDIIALAPKVRFRIESGKHQGYLDIEYDRGLDYYRVKLIEDISLNTLKEIDDVDFTSLAEVVADLVDDGQWRMAKVEVLKPAPKLKKAA